MSPVAFRISYDFGDVVEVQRASWKTRVSRIMLVFCAVFMIATSVLLKPVASAPRPLLYVAPWAALIALMGIGLPRVSAIVPWLAIRTAPQPVQVQLTEDGIRLSGREGDRWIGWDYFTRLMRTNRLLILLRDKPHDWLALPLRDLTAAGVNDEVMAILETKLTSSRNASPGR